MLPVYTLLVALVVALVALFLVPNSVAAAPMTLSDTITYLGAPSGTYKYDFTLTVDNHDGTWSPGQKFDYLSFGNETSRSGPFGQFGDWSWTATPTSFAHIFDGHGQWSDAQFLRCRNQLLHLVQGWCVWAADHRREIGFRRIVIHVY